MFRETASGLANYYAVPGLTGGEIALGVSVEIVNQTAWKVNEWRDSLCVSEHPHSVPPPVIAELLTLSPFSANAVHLPRLAELTACP